MEFQYKIEISEEIDNERILVPPMFLQPYIENSIWHGILPSDKKGIIQLNIYKVNQEIVFEIFDSGIGIDESLERKKGTISSHSSKGVKITSDRIELLKKIIGKEIKVEGPYQINEENKSLGTKVKITFYN